MKKALLISALALALTGCASSQRMSIKDINEFELDCEVAEEQHAFLRSQMPTRHDKQTSLFSIMSIFGYLNAHHENTIDHHSDVRSGVMQATVRGKLRQLEAKCE